jgi:hypothetical protein
MLRFQFHKKEKHLEFNYIPRYYDPEQEKKVTKDNDEVTAIKQRIQNRLSINPIHQKLHKTKGQMIVLGSLLLSVCVILYLVFSVNGIIQLILGR